MTTKKNGKHLEAEEVLGEVEDAEERGRLFELARKVALASVGAVALTQDEVEKFIDKLVERGEVAEKDARKLMRELSHKSRRTTDKRMEEVLHRMDIPTRADIKALSLKIAALTEKVETLKKAPA
jgi:polyhydroxyalkanoate synthesis regulator phasin